MSVVAVALAELRAGVEEERHIGAEPRRRARASRSAASGSSSVSFASAKRGRRVGAAAAEPGGDRDPLLDRACQRGSTPAASASASSARADERVVGEPVDAELGAPARARSGRRASIRCRTVATSCLPSSRRGPTTSARLIFAVARRASSRRSASASATNSGGSSASARTPAIAADAPRAPPPPRSRVATPASSSELASVLRRCANAPWTTLLERASSVGQLASAGTRRAPSRRSAAAGRPCATTGWKPVRSAVSWTSTETAP